jgi:hypothetical protein
MQGLLNRILTVNLVASTVVFYAAAIVLSTLFGAPPYMGVAYWIPAFWVPALLVTHYITFLVLRGDVEMTEGRASR